MKNITITLILLVLSSCITNVETKYDFINKLIKEPDNYESIIKKSKFYTPDFERYYLKRFNKYLKDYLKNNFTGEKYLITFDSTITIQKPGSDKKEFYFQNIIKVESKNEIIYFGFYEYKNDWYIYDITTHNPMESPLRNDDDYR